MYLETGIGIIDCLNHDTPVKLDFWKKRLRSED